MKPGPKPKSPYERVMVKVEKQENGCWLYTGCLSKSGHGNVSLFNPETGKRTHQNAHAIVADFVKGKLPKGKVWRHTCDVANCVNPDHQIPGTQKENIQDIIDRNRGLFGRKKQPEKEREDKSEDCPF